MEELIKRKESINHLKHFGKKDPNLVIYEAFMENGETQKAERFLNYRKAWEGAAKTGELPEFPYFVTMGLNNSCNLACAHCYRTFETTDYKKNHLEFEEISRVIKECKAIGVHSVAVGSESEILAYKRVTDVINLLSEMDFTDTWINTNGLLLDDKYADLILNSNITRVSISIDAVTDKTYKKVRGGNFYKLMANIFNFLDKRAKLKKKLPILRVTAVKYNLNEPEIDTFVDFWSNIVDEVDVQPLIDIKNVNDLRYDTIDKVHCTYPNRMMYINWNGDYRPCCSEFSKHIVIGNIKDMTVMDAWKSEYLRGIRDELEGKKALNKACLNCLRSLHTEEKYEPLV